MQYFYLFQRDKNMIRLYLIVIFLYSHILNSAPPENYEQLEKIMLLGTGLSPISLAGVSLYKIKDTNQVVAVKELQRERNWINEIEGILRIGKFPYTVQLISVIEGKASSNYLQLMSPPVWLVMEPYLGGTLGDAVGALTGKKFESDYETMDREYAQYPSLADEHAKFYLANLGLMLDNIHNTSKWAWLDVKPANVLVDSKNGYLRGTDFGISQKNGSVMDDWKQLGKRILAEGFRINLKNSQYNQHSTDLKNLIGMLESGMITSLDDLKKHQFFKGFDWDKMAKEELLAPYIPKGKIPKCEDCIPYRRAHGDEVYIAPEFVEQIKQ